MVIGMDFGTREFHKASEETVNPDLRSGRWQVFERYEIRESDQNLVAWDGYDALPPEEGRSLRLLVPPHEYDPSLAYVRVPNDSYESYEEYRPLIDTPGLFLEFAQLADEDITREVWLDWVRCYGVLGLGLHDPRKASSMDVRVCEIGGWGETFRNFVREACRANWLLDLYQFAMSPEQPNGALACPTGFRVQGHDEWYEPLAVPPEGSDPATLRQWALGMVGFEVNLQMRQSFPRMYSATGERHFLLGWDFYSLLGAMYLQMSWLATAKGEEVRWCKMPGCNNVIAFEQPEQGAPAGTKRNDRSMGYRTRNDKKFCSDQCKGRYHYHYRKKAKHRGAQVPEEWQQ